GSKSVTQTQKKSAACSHLRVGVCKTITELLRASYLPMCSWVWRTTRFESRRPPPCVPQGTEWYEAVANIIEPSRLSSFRLIRRRNSFLRSISCAKNGTSARKTITDG